MTEKRKISRGDLKRLCVSKNWYTRGTNEDYERLLDYADICSENATTANIVHMAENIKRLSETEQTLPSICYDIAKICSNFFYDNTPQLSSEYWDCQCDERYIQPNSVDVCPICGAERGEMPDSHQNEVDEGTHFAQHTA